MMSEGEEEAGEQTAVKMETITVSIPNDDSTSLLSQPARVSDAIIIVL